jgi:hypothetical protein
VTAASVVRVPIFEGKEVEMRVLAALVSAVVFFGLSAPAAADGGWVWPVEGLVLTPYSNDNARPYAGGMHRGIDIAAGVGTGVVAARAGTVTHAGVVGSSGLTLSVRTGDGRYVTSYLHLSAIALKEGETVTAGARIGEVGTSGRRSVQEPHLHFGVRLADREDQYVDPLSLLPSPAAPSVAPAAPVRAPVPLRAERQPVPVRAPVAVRVPVIPRARPVAAPVRVRPRGTLQPGAAWAPAPMPVRTAPAGARSRSAAPRRVPAGPEPGMAPAPATRPPAPDRASAPTGSGPGRQLVLAGLGLVALALFGGVAWRSLARVNAGVNGRAAAAAASIRDRARIGPALRRLLSLKV